MKLMRREAGHTKLWRRISMMNPREKGKDKENDLLGTTTWGVRKVIWLGLIFIFFLTRVYTRLENQREVEKMKLLHFFEKMKFLHFFHQMALEALGWSREPREDVSWVMEGRLLFTQPTDNNWKNLFTVKLTPVTAILVTLGQNTLAPPPQLLKEVRSYTWRAVIVFISFFDLLVHFTPP